MIGPADFGSRARALPPRRDEDLESYLRLEWQAGSPGSVLSTAARHPRSRHPLVTRLLGAIRAPFRAGVHTHVAATGALVLPHPAHRLAGSCPPGEDRTEVCLTSTR